MVAGLGADKTPPKSRGANSIPGWIICALLVLVTSLLGYLHILPGHYWGDDFAGYLLQAEAILSGQMAEEVRINAESMAASDWRVGPDAYPWGYPALLAAAGAASDWAMPALKVVGLGALLISALGTFAVGRSAGLGLLAAATCAVVVGWQPATLQAVDKLESDLPFLAVSSLGILLVARLISARGSTGNRALLCAFAAALLAVAAFAIRSNGAVLIGATVFGLACNAILAAPTRRLRAWMVCGLYAGTTLLGVWLYFQLLPDGSLIAATYLSADPAILARRFVEHVHAIGDMMPIAALGQSLEYVATCGVFLLCIAGAVSSNALGWFLAIYVGGHLSLLTVFPYDGGLRYCYPLLPAVAVLAACGLRVTYRLLLIALPPRVAQLRDVWSAAFCAAISIALLVGVWYSLRKPPYDLAAGPYAAPAQQILATVREELPGNALIAFSKPRAMRWFTGRRALVARQIETATRADAILLHLSGGEQAVDQVPIGKLGSLRQFRLAASNKYYALYVRD